MVTKEAIETLAKQDLIYIQNQLQNDSDKILEKLVIIETLSKYIKPEIVGAKRMGLMVKKDIDIICPIQEFDKKIWFSICNDLLKIPYIRKIEATNYVDYLNEGVYAPNNPNPFSYYILLKDLVIPGIDLSQEWEIQIQLMKSLGSVRYADEIKNKLNPATKEIILRIKLIVNEVSTKLKSIIEQSKTNLPNINPGISSMVIYEAVLNHGIMDTTSFFDYYLDFEQNKTKVSMIKDCLKYFMVGDPGLEPGTTRV